MHTHAVLDPIHTAQNASLCKGRAEISVLSMEFKCTLCMCDNGHELLTTFTQCVECIVIAKLTQRDSTHHTCSDTLTVSHSHVPTTPRT